MDPAKEGEEIENEAQQVKTEQPLNVANGVEKDAELPQKVESLDDIISNIKTVEVESEKLENQEATLLKEKIEKGREAIKPFEVAKEFIKKIKTFIVAKSIMEF